NHLGASISAAMPHASRPSGSPTRAWTKTWGDSVSVAAPKRKGMRKRTSRSERRTSRTLIRGGVALSTANPLGDPEDKLPLGLLPDIPVVHQLDLPLDDLVPVFLVLHGRAVQVQVLR